MRAQHLVGSGPMRVDHSVKVRRDQQFPADLVLISASNSLGKCFVMTANLDGETNLKPLFASKAELSTAQKTREELSSLIP